LVRILAGIPLGSTNIVKPAVMMNLLGGEGFSGTYAISGLDEISRLEGVYVHLYGKKESKPKRKMGHITVLGNTPMDAHEKALFIQSKVGIVKG
jgi:5-(carboxyamino)imidazole ribonucleotide synthase